MREAKVRLRSTAFETMGVEELVELCRDARLRAFEELACHGDGAIVQVEVESAIDEPRLDEVPYVDQWERVAEAGGVYLYVIEFTAPALSDEMSTRTEDLIGTCDPDVDERGATLSLVGSQAAIRRVVDQYLEVGVSPALRKLGEYEGRDRPMEHLTDRQRNVLEVAYESGYYEVPRTASTEEVADAVGIDPSTAAEHLQRAERNLLTQHLSVES